MKYHIPKNKKMLDEVYVALSLDENGEGIISLFMNGSFCPFVFGHKQTMDDFMPVLKEAVNDTGATVRVFKFKKTELLLELPERH